MNQGVKILTKPNVIDILDLLDVRQRRYVLQVTLGRLSQSAAANDAGFKQPPKSLAVTNAIHTLQVEMARDLEIDLNHVNRGLQDAIEMARAQGEPMSMIAGYREQGKLAGLYVERKSIDVTLRHLREEDLQELSEAELNELIEHADAIELRPSEFERVK